MNNFAIKICLSLVYFISIQTYGQLNFKKTKINEFPFSQETSGFQDEKGAFWLTSGSNVLYCDGQRTVKIYDRTNVINSQINEIAPINRDSILVGTDHGLGIISKGVLKPIGINKAVWGMTRVRDNFLYIGTTSGLYKWYNGKIYFLQATKGLDIGELTSDSNGDPYFSTYGTIYSVKKNKLELVCKTANLFAIPFMTKKGELLYGDTSLHKVVNGKSIEILRTEVPISNISESKDGVVYFCANKLYSYSKDKAMESFKLEDKSSPVIFRTIFDKMGKMYLIASHNLYVQSTKFYEETGIKIGNTLFYSQTSDSTYRRIYEDKGVFFLDINGNVVQLYKSYKSTKDKDKINWGFLYDAYFVSDKEFYLSFLKGCQYFHDGIVDYIGMPSYSNCAWFYHVPERNELWLHTTRAPALIKGNTVYSFSESKGYTPPFSSLSAMLPDKILPIIWYASYEGDFGYLDLVKNKYVKLDSAIGLKVNKNQKFNVSNIVLDNQNNIWVYALNKGLHKVLRNGNDPSKYKCIVWDANAPEGQYKFDKMGNLWCISKEIRIYKAKQTHLENPMSYVTINMDIDLNGISDIKENTALEFDRHFMSNNYFNLSVNLHSNLNYKVSIPSLFSLQTSPAAVSFTKVLLNRNPINWDSAGYSTDVVGLPKNPNFDYTIKDLGFQFGSFSSATGNGVYRFKLNGYDSSWSTTSETEIVYGNLPPKNYFFEVQFSNDGFNWSDSSVYQFSIESPFWKKIWFQILALLFLGGLVGLYFRYRISRINAFNTKLQLEVEKRTEELHHTNLSLYETNQKIAMLLSVIAHDVKSPLRFLSSVSLKLNESWNKLEDKDKMHYSTEIQKSTSSLYVFVSDFLSWINLEKDAKYIKSEQVNVSQLLLEVKEFHEQNGNLKTNTIEIVSEKEVFLVTKKHYLSIVIRNILDNAIKYTSNGRIYLSVIQEAGKITVSCQDTGIGMTQDVIDKILDTENKTEAYSDNSFKMGYSFVNQLAKILQAEIQITSELDKGTKVEIVFEN